MAELNFLFEKIWRRCRQNRCSVICVIRWEPRSQWARSAACVPSGGRERCVQTQGAHWRGGTQFCFFYCSQSSTQRRGTSSDGSLLDGKKERENAPDRKDSRHSSFPSVVTRGGEVSRCFLCASGPLKTDVSGPPQSGCSAAPPAKPNCVTGGFTLHLDVLICTRTSLWKFKFLSWLFFFNIFDASIQDEPLLEIIVSPPFPPPD